MALFAKCGTFFAHLNWRSAAGGEICLLILFADDATALVTGKNESEKQ
jgi:hypothetical protein